MQVIFRRLDVSRWNYFAAALLKSDLHLKLCRSLVNKYVVNANKQVKSLPFKWTTFIAVSWLLGDSGSGDQFNKKLKEADSLYEKGQYSECTDYLTKLQKSEGSENVELLWRMSRLLYNMSKDPNNSSKKKYMISEAYDLIYRALELDPNHFTVHKWYAILLDAKSAYIGIKQRIAELETVKQHMLIASELNPKDATTLYMLGEWCYQIADMPWYQRSIASTLFATPPTSTYEESLVYFLKAEQAEPRFYSLNLLMLGKTYLKLGKTEQAKYYLNLALSYPAKTNDDHTANIEAKALLSSLRP